MEDNIFNILRILADWLKSAEDEVDTYHDGHLEASIKRAKKETKEEIGDYLEEILNMNDEQIRYELNSIDANNQMKDNLPF